MELKYSQPSGRPCVPRVASSSLREIVERLSFPRVYGTPENLKARDVVVAEFKMLGKCSIVGETQNIILGDLHTARILIGAHYDSVPGTPGADDNASAVAVMLAVMKILGPLPHVAAVAFNCEESGLKGSREFVQLMPRAHALEEVHVLEMVGFRSREPNSQRDPVPGLHCPTTGDFLGIVGNDELGVERILKAAEKVTIPVVGLALPEGIPLSLISSASPHLFRSDHASFWEQGERDGQAISATMWTDTAEFRNPNYHQSTDTPETLDYEFMAEVAELLLEVINPS